MKEEKWIISETEKTVCKELKDKALDLGASDIQLCLNKSSMDEIILLNGEINKVLHSADRVLSICLYVDGRYGTFSINKFEKEDLERFLSEAIKMVRMLEIDDCRCLADKERFCKTAINGNELNIYDDRIHNIETTEYLSQIQAQSKYAEYSQKNLEWKLISEEISYSSSVYDQYIINSQGLEARASETSFELYCQLSILDEFNKKYTADEWCASCLFKDFKDIPLFDRALTKALAQRNPIKIKSRKTNLIVDAEYAYTLIKPLLNALNGYAIQQSNSFLLNKLGESCFSPNLNIFNCTVEKGRNGARIFDSQGLEYKNGAIIWQGILKEYFINNYISKKMNMPATNEDSPRLIILPYMEGNEDCKNLRENYLEHFVSSIEIKDYIKIEKEDLFKACGDGIYVCGFNGGNSNILSGDFSYGVEGFLIEDGKITSPVRELLITGNLLDLWNNIIGIASDYNLNMSRQIPSIAFSNVDFSGE